MTDHASKHVFRKKQQFKKKKICITERVHQNSLLDLYHYKLFYLMTMADCYFSINNKQFHLQQRKFCFSLRIPKHEKKKQKKPCNS